MAVLPSGLTGASVEAPAAQRLRASSTCDGQRLRRPQTCDLLHPETPTAMLLGELAEETHVSGHAHGPPGHNVPSCTGATPAAT